MREILRLIDMASIDTHNHSRTLFKDAVLIETTVSMLQNEYECGPLESKIWAGETEVFDENQPKCHTVHQKCHKTWHWNVPEQPRVESSH
jgi:hypothetical protein